MTGWDQAYAHEATAAALEGGGEAEAAVEHRRQAGDIYEALGF